MFHEWLEKKILQESMDVYIKDYQDESLRDIEDISNFLRRNVLYGLWDKMTPEQQKSVVDGGSNLHGMITPDGNYYQDGEEIISFYIDGWEEEMVQKAIQGIKYYLDEKGIKYGAFNTEQSRMFNGKVVRIPILHKPPQNDVPARINMSNSNAALIFGDVLGYPRNQDGFFGINPRDLLVKIENLPDYAPEIHQKDPYQSKGETGPTFHHGGLDKSSIIRRLQQIRQVAEWAIKNNYDEIYVT